MIIKTLYAISRATGFLAKSLEKSSKATDALIEKEYIFNTFRFAKEKAGKVVEKIGYTVGQMEERLDQLK